jgi:hypothetical protein
MKPVKCLCREGPRVNEDGWIVSVECDNGNHSFLCRDSESRDQAIEQWNAEIARIRKIVKES